MADLGVRTLDEMIGRTDFLETNTAILPWKAKEIDFSKILYRPHVAKNVGAHCLIKQKHEIEDVLDLKLIALAKNALERSEPVHIELPIENVNRTTGAMLSGRICKLYGEGGLNENTIHCKFKGVAGQSFGAWLAKGVTFELEGMANDYVGKGISGGKVIIYPARQADYKSEENIIIGNTAFYGAIVGEAYIRGVAGERFCIRNSGLSAVVEGVGDHGCEYMTGGRVIILGKTGRNFAAGMSGGIAYIYDKDSSFKEKCNLVTVGLEGCSVDDVKNIYDLLRAHHQYTQSKVAEKILDNFAREIKKFLKVMPKEYKRILEIKQMGEKLDVGEVSDG
jgi:glutamate synthase domain-containing protein 3